jgi:CheY-like chemotaxis protein
MFEPFFSTKPPGRGTGLGLATVHGTVRTLGGQIDVRSALGAGTTITVRLPAIAPATAHPPLVVAPAAPGRADRPRVLVVDDDDSVRRATVRMLARHGFDSRDMADPREAVAHLRDDPWAVDIVLTDLTMPHLSGLALAESVRAIAPHLPVVLMTGMVDATNAAEARAEGVAAVLTKPFSSRELATVLSAVAPLAGEHHGMRGR